MATPPHAPAPVPIYLCGSKPGVFDPTQPSRLLRYSDSTLLFASFNPLSGGGPPLSADALTRARRIVVEVPQANDFSERPNWFSFVPNAVLAPGVASEGKWPRVVNYCGQWVVCDQDQWDIHKLDPMYDCFVPTAGMHPTITKKIYAQVPAAGIHTRPRKRGLSFEGDQPPPFYASKKARGDAAPYPEPGRRGADCPDVPMGETTFASSSTSTAGPASGAPPVFIFSTPVPPTASSAAPSSSTRSSGRPHPRTPDIVDLTMDEDGEHLGEQARAEKEPCTRQTGYKQSAAEDAIAAVLARRQAQVAAAAGSRAHAVRACPDLEGRQRRQEHRRQWMPWTQQRAIDRYLAVSEEFDNARFSHENPVDLLFIPWPVLRSPFTLLVNEVDWQMVEAFFEEAARQMEIEDYRVFVAESHRRFHPDRWRSRGVFRACDNELAQTLERACTIVSQALTPIWTVSRTG